MNRHKIRTMTFAVGGAMLLWIGILVLGTLFIWGGFEKVRVEHRTLQIRIQELQKKQDKITSALVAYENRRDDIALLEAALLSEDDILPLLLSFEGHADVTGNDYKVQVTKEDLSIVLHIELSGTFEGLYGFLDRIQASPYLMQIQRMNTRLYETEGEVATSLRVRVFSLLQKQ